MSQFGNTLIGAHSRHRLKKSSPYATLLLDVGMGLCEGDVSSLKLALQVDKFVKRIELNKLKNGHEILSHMYGIGLISETDTQFLENLLIHICRKDLVKRIEHYHSRRLNATDGQKLSSAHPLPDTTNSENTVPKQVFEAYDSDTNVSSSTRTFSKSPVKSSMKPGGNRSGEGVDASDFTALKTPVMPVNQYYMNQLPQSIKKSPFAPLGASPALSGAVMPYESPVKPLMPSKYSENRLEEGGDSVHVATYTALKTPVSQCYQPPQNVAYSPFAHLGTRSAPDGVSVPNVFNSSGPNSSPASNRACNVSELSNTGASSQEDIEMKNSQRCSGSQDSQMSISDDEKLGYYQDKALFTDGDSSLSNMQFSQ